MCMRAGQFFYVLITSRYTSGWLQLSLISIHMSELSIQASTHTLPEGLYLIWNESAKLDYDLWLENRFESLQSHRNF